MAKNIISYNYATREIIYATTSVILPTEKGLHIISGGCGCGKTTNIEKIVRSPDIQSVLIVVPTIEAADELGKRLESSTKRVRVLHSGSNAKDALTEYRKNPQFLTDIDVLIITSARPIIDPYPLFIHYKDGYRDYVLIDEMINFYPPKFGLPRDIVDIVTYYDRKKTHNRIKGEEVQIGSKSFFRHIYKDSETMMAAYIKSSFTLSKAKTALDREKAKVLFEHIVKDGLKPFQNRIVDIATELPVILFDGTADILFKKDSRLIPITGKKYRSDITFAQFHMPIQRKNGKDWNISSLGYAIDPIAKIIKDNPGKTLVVTWKTIDKFPEKTIDADKIETLAPIKYEFTGILRQKLIDAGVDGNGFDVIYRGSGEDRGSNRFYDFTNIVFFGEWRIPDDIVSEINLMFGCKSTFDDYKLSLMVQTICRTRIRQHNGDPIKVFFSDDISYNLMYDVQEYFRENSDPSCHIDGILTPCPKYSKRDKKKIIAVSRLFNYDPKIATALVQNTPYSFNIKLNDLYLYVPQKRKAKDRYSSLLQYLSSRGIDMNII